MKVFNSFGEMFNAQSNKQDMSVFNDSKWAVHHKWEDESNEYEWLVCFASDLEDRGYSDDEIEAQINSRGYEGDLDQLYRDYESAKEDLDFVFYHIWGFGEADSIRDKYPIYTLGSKVGPIITGYHDEADEWLEANVPDVYANIIDGDKGTVYSRVPLTDEQAESFAKAMAVSHGYFRKD